MWRDGVRNQKIDATESRRVQESEARLTRLQEDLKKPGVTAAQCDEATKALAAERAQVQEFLRTTPGGRAR